MKPRMALLLLLVVPVVAWGQGAIPGSLRPTKIPLHAHRDISDGGRIPLSSLLWDIGTTGSAGTIAYTDVANDWSVNQSFGSGITLPGALDAATFTSINDAASSVQLSAVNTGSSLYQVFLPSGSGTLVSYGVAGTWDQLQNFYDTAIKIVDDGDPTKTAAFSLGGATAGADLTLTWAGTADANVALPITGTIATLAGSETFTNKTLTTPVIADFTSANHDHLDADDGGTLSASAIASGTLPVARGGTGTTTSTGTGYVVLSGDPELTGSPILGDQPIIGDFTQSTHDHEDAAGGGVLGLLATHADYCKTTQDYDTTTTTLTDVYGMDLTVAANTTYRFEFWVPWMSDNTANGISFAVTCPSSPTAFYYAADIGIRSGGTASASGMFHGDADASATELKATSVSTASRVNMARVWGVLINGANAGSLQLQYAGEDGTNSSTVKVGAHGLLSRLP